VKADKNVKIKKLMGRAYAEPIDYVNLNNYHQNNRNAKIGHRSPDDRG
jgi:hypothetical protein